MWQVDNMPTKLFTLVLEDAFKRKEGGDIALNIAGNPFISQNLLTTVQS